jgi:hypothetical protein
LTELTVNRLHSQYKQDLRIDNGAGASILLTGDRVLINGLDGGGGNVFDIIYIGSNKDAWITRDSITGDLVFHVPAGKGILFEDVHVGTMTTTDAVYIMETSPDENLSASAYMTVASTPARTDVLILFDTTGFTWPVTSAVLRLYVTSTIDTAGLTLSKLQHTFNPVTVTWNTQPTYVTSETLSSFSIAPGNATGWVDLDVTDLFNEDANRMVGKFGLNISYLAASGVTFSSGAGTDVPQLIITE